MTEWKARQLQLAWFFVDAKIRPASTVFEAMAKSEPSLAQTAQMAGIGPASTAIGNAGSHSLTVQSQRGRLDCILAGQPSEDASFPLINDVNSTIDDLIHSTGSAGPQIGEATRLAFVGTFVRWAKTVEEATEYALDLTGVKIPYAGISDFSLSLNRRTTLQGLGVEINRVLRWGVEAAQLVNVGIGVITSGVSTTLAAQQIATTVTIDINTAPALDRAFDPGKQIPILMAMGGEMKRIWPSPTLLVLS